MRLFFLLALGLGWSGVRAEETPPLQCPPPLLAQAGEGAEWCVQTLEDGSQIKQGPYRSFYPNGQPKKKGQFDKGKMTGTWKVWFSSGELMAEGGYKEGRQHGLVTVWYRTGMKKVEVELDQDVKNGALRRWYPDGTQQVESRYQQGKLGGPYTSWHPNGALFQKGEYRDDRQVGVWIVGSMDGERTETEPEKADENEEPASKPTEPTD